MGMKGGFHGHERGITVPRVGITVPRVYRWHSGGTYLEEQLQAVGASPGAPPTSSVTWYGASSRCGRRD